MNVSTVSTSSLYSLVSSGALPSKQTGSTSMSSQSYQCRRRQNRVFYEVSRPCGDLPSHDYDQGYGTGTYQSDEQRSCNACQGVRTYPDDDDSDGDAEQKRGVVGGSSQGVRHQQSILSCEKYSSLEIIAAACSRCCHCSLASFIHESASYTNYPSVFRGILQSHYYSIVVGVSFEEGHEKDQNNDGENDGDVVVLAVPSHLVKRSSVRHDTGSIRVGGHGAGDTCATVVSVVEERVVVADEEDSLDSVTIIKSEDRRGGAGGTACNLPTVCIEEEKRDHYTMYLNKNRDLVALDPEWIASSTTSSCSDRIGGSVALSVLHNHRTTKAMLLKLFNDSHHVHSVHVMRQQDSRSSREESMMRVDEVLQETIEAEERMQDRRGNSLLSPSSPGKSRGQTRGMMNSESDGNKTDANRQHSKRRPFLLLCPCDVSLADDQDSIWECLLDSTTPRKSGSRASVDPMYVNIHTNEKKRALPVPKTSIFFSSPQQLRQGRTHEDQSLVKLCNQFLQHVKHQVSIHRRKSKRSAGMIRSDRCSGHPSSFLSPIRGHNGKNNTVLASSLLSGFPSPSSSLMLLRSSASPSALQVQAATRELLVDEDTERTRLLERSLEYGGSAQRTTVTEKEKSERLLVETGSSTSNIRASEQSGQSTTRDLQLSQPIMSHPSEHVATNSSSKSVRNDMDSHDHHHHHDASSAITNATSTANHDDDGHYFQGESINAEAMAITQRLKGLRELLRTNNLKTTPGKKTKKKKGEGDNGSAVVVELPVTPESVASRGQQQGNLLTCAKHANVREENDEEKAASNSVSVTTKSPNKREKTGNELKSALAQREKEEMTVDDKDIAVEKPTGKRQQQHDYTTIVASEVRVDDDDDGPPVPHSSTRQFSPIPPPIRMGTRNIGNTAQKRNDKKKTKNASSPMSTSSTALSVTTQLNHRSNDNLNDKDLLYARKILARNQMDKRGSPSTLHKKLQTRTGKKTHIDECRKLSLNMASSSLIIQSKGVPSRSSAVAMIPSNDRKTEMVNGHAEDEEMLVSVQHEMQEDRRSDETANVSCLPPNTLASVPCSEVVGVSTRGAAAGSQVQNPDDPTIIVAGRAKDMSRRFVDQNQMLQAQQDHVAANNNDISDSPYVLTTSAPLQTEPHQGKKTCSSVEVCVHNGVLFLDALH